MTEDDPRDPRSTRPTLQQRFVRVRNFVWSNLTDPAILVYRRSAQGKDKARVLMVEFFLFVREVTREFYDIEGASAAAALAYTTLVSLIPLLVAFNQVLQQYFKSIFPDFRTQVDTLLNVVIPYQSPQLAYHLERFAERRCSFDPRGNHLHGRVLPALPGGRDHHESDLEGAERTRIPQEDHGLHDALLLGSFAHGSLVHHYSHAAAEQVPPSSLST